MNTFLGKPWNDAVFSKYVGTVPRVKVNAFLNSGVFRTRDDIKNLFQIRLVDIMRLFHMLEELAAMLRTMMETQMLTQAKQSQVLHRARSLQVE